MLYFFFGEESFLIKEKVDCIKKDFISKKPDATVNDFSLNESDPEKIRESLSLGGGLFSQKKMVLIRDVFEENKQIQEELTGILDGFASKKDLEIVVVHFGKKPGKNKLFNFLKKAAQIEEFPFLKSNEVKEWIILKIKEKSDSKIGANNEVINYLEANYGKNLWKLNNELEKLVNYRIEKGGNIEKGDLDLFCERLLEVKIFDFVDAIGMRNKKRSVELLNSLLKSGEDAFYIFSMIIYQIRNIARVDYCRKKGVLSQDAIAGETGLHPFVAKKTLNQLRNFNTAEIKKIYEICYSLDFAVKTGKLEIKDALRDLVVKI
ncbi:MAG: DNA polymerase III subunit delta [Candidatus Moraniibacteriota bacterium]